MSEVFKFQIVQRIFPLCNLLKLSNMKKIIIIFWAVLFSCFSFAANKAETLTAADIVGTYSTSAYEGTYRLLEDNGFPKRACVVSIQLKALPEGYHYDWEVLRGNGDEQLQIQPDNNFAYFGQNGHTDCFDFSISIIDEVTGYPVATRRFSFVFIENFTKPIIPPLS